VCTTLLSGGVAASAGGVVAALGGVGAEDTDLYVLDNAGEPRLLVDTPGRVTRAAWDPSGSHLILTDILPDRRADHRVITFDADGRVVGNQRLLLVEAPPTRMATSAIYTWHPAGDSVLYKREDRACAGNVVLRRFLDGSEDVFLDPAVVGDGVVYSIDVHPNGREVIWTSQVGCWSPTLKLFKAPLVDGAIDLRSIQLLLDDGTYVSPAVYSPDGSHIAFRRSDARAGFDGPENLYVMRSDGSGMRSLTGNTSAAERVLGHIVWSPDGRELLFSQSHDWLAARTVQVYRARVDGSGTQPVTATAGQALVVAHGVAGDAVAVDAARGPVTADAQPLGVDRLDHRHTVDWGAFEAMLPTVRGFAGTVSETGVTATFAPAETPGAWFVDVVVSGIPAAGPSADQDVRLVSVFPVGVVSVALPEPDAWVDYEGVTVSLFEPVEQRWIAVQDGLSRPGAESVLGAWVDAAFVAIDAVSLTLPKVQLLKLALLLPEVAIEHDEARWLTSFDAASVVPSEQPFLDPNTNRVVQVPWRFDGLEGAALAERVWGDDRTVQWPWGTALQDDGLAPVRVRVPVMGLSEATMADVRVSVAVTEEHTIFARPGPRSPLTGTAASPIARPPRFLVQPVGWESVSGYTLRAVTSGLRRVATDEGAPDATWGERLERSRQLPLRPDFAGAESFSFDGSTGGIGTARLRYESSVSLALERAGPISWVFVLGVEASVPTRTDGRNFVDGRRSYTLDHRDGVAYLALPNVPGLEVDYDAVAVEAFDQEVGRWEVVPNHYAGPTRRAAWDRMEQVAWGLVLGHAFEALAGQGVARTVKAVGIVADVAGLVGPLEPASAPDLALPLPIDSAFYDPNRFRVVELPWEVGVMEPGWHTVPDDMLRFVNPYDHERGALRLRVRVPVRGLTTAEVADARGFVAAVERVVRWDAVNWSAALGRAIVEPSLTERRLLSGVSLAVAAPADETAAAGDAQRFAVVARFVDPVGAGSFFARGAAISGDTVLIGAPSDIYDGQPETTFVFERVGDAWLETQRLDPIGTLFGSSVAVDGDLAAVTAPFFGSTTVYRRVEGGRWRPLQTVDRGDTVVVSGRDVLVGDLDRPSSHDPDDLPRPGSVRVYRVAGERVDLVTQLHSVDATARGLFGLSIASDADVVLVGAPGSAQPGAPPTGSAYIFDRATWRPLTAVRPASHQAGDGTGVAVALHSRYALVGAPGASDGAGAVHVFERGDRGWDEVAAIAPPSAVAAREFGRTLAVAGDLLFVGAPGTANADGTFGEVFVYRLSDGVWLHSGGLRAAAGAEVDDHGFGHRVAVSGSMVLVTADASAYVFAPSDRATSTGRHE